VKVLFIGNNSDFEESVKKLIATHYTKLELIEMTESSSLIEMLTSNGPFSFVITTLNRKTSLLSDQFNTITEALGVRPFIIIGQDKVIKSQTNNIMIPDSNINFLIQAPPSLEAFRRAVNAAIEWVKKEEYEESIIELSKEDLHKMRLRNFYLFEQIPYDVYLELTATKFGKIISKDKPFSYQIIQNYARRNVKHFYLRKDEHLKFLDVSIKNLLMIYNAKMVDKKKRINLHLKTLFFIQQYVVNVSVSEDIIKLTNYFIDSVSEYVKSHNDLDELLSFLTQNESMSFAEQSLATAYLCELILIQMGWNADMSRNKLFLAAILQDVGLNNDEMIKIRSLNDPAYKILNEEEQAIYKNHPKTAARLSTYFSGFSDVDFILSEQHEHPSGDGFPNGLNSSGLTTISCLFIIANNFVSRIAFTQFTPTIHKDVFLSMKKVYNTGNFKNPIKALEKVIKKL